MITNVAPQATYQQFTSYGNPTEVMPSNQDLPNHMLPFEKTKGFISSQNVNDPNKNNDYIRKQEHESTDLHQERNNAIKLPQFQPEYFRSSPYSQPQVLPLPSSSQSVVNNGTGIHGPFADDKQLGSGNPQNPMIVTPASQNFYQLPQGSTFYHHPYGQMATVQQPQIINQPQTEQYNSYKVPTYNGANTGMFRPSQIQQPLVPVNSNTPVLPKFLDRPIATDPQAKRSNSSASYQNDSVNKNFNENNNSNTLNDTTMDLSLIHI